MTSGPSNASPAPGFFQAIQGLVRPADAPGANPAAKPVAPPEQPRHVNSVDRAPKPTAGEAPRHFPRGSFLDIRV